LIFKAFSILFSLFLIVGCTPEDGWCAIETYSGGNDFNCSKLDDDFSCSGQSILEEFTNSKFIYRKTEVADSSEFETVMDKPDYIPETITILSMNSCLLAPKIGGIDCKSWTEFSFKTEEGFDLRASSKYKNKTTSTCDPKYIEIELEEKTFTGIKSDSELFISDSVIKSGEEVRVRHYYISN